MAKTKVLSYALASLAFASIVLFSCSDSGQGTYSQTEEQTQNDTEINILTSVFPSPKEQNPYSVENMNKTFKKLVLANNANAKDIPELEANFLYVRFLPYGKHGVYELKTYDTSLVLFKHPMDYNEIRKPVVYIDKTLPDSIIPYFATVPVGYEFGSTPYEILQELFLTQPLEEDEGDYQEDSYFVKAKRANKASKEIAAYLQNQDLTPSQLEAMAFPNSERFKAEIESGSNKVLAKNTSFDKDNIVAWSLWPSRWRPSGILNFYDEQLEKEVPLVWVRVTAGYFYYWRSSRTDDDGSFQSPERWTFSVDYEANFDSQQFLLQDGHSWYGEDLEIEKNNKKSAWKETFDGKHARWCVVWTAAYNYWYGDIYGLQRPRQNDKLDPFRHSLEINVYYKNNKDYEDSFTCWVDGVFGTDGCKNSVGFHNVGPLWQNIMIQTYDRNNSRPVPHINIYGTTIHEIAHSSHYDNMDTRYWYLPQSVEFGKLLPILRESYARGVQRYLSIKHYGTWSGNYDDWAKGYTGVFEDLEDANSTYAKIGDNERTCDRVSGITVPMVEKVLFESYSWNDFRDNLMKEYPSGTPNGKKGEKVTYFAVDMDSLFKYWETGIGTPCPEPIADTRDGKVYRTVIMGTQTWMAENLNYDTTGSKCYSNEEANCVKYGRLYDWSTAMALPSSCNSATCSGQVNAKHQGICPTGWRIPSTADWDKLMRYIDGDKTTYSPYDSPMAGKYLKAISGWGGGGDNSNGEDKYGFSALPGGYGYSNGFRNVGTNGDWWSTSEYDGTSAYRFDLYHGDKAGWEDIDGNRKHNKSNLFSIRCVKD
ncbi:MAG: fibrobacter succinogenes major paralogous domain-containing protein [Fibromonadaceae bacterium]|jgi:uncharacterized protein (TIGR02145 family)|nr:fibrobacter succinogenes major paralogous domain-containing protein [Fibromonadaceae bacterium]